MHPYLIQEDLLQYCREKRIQVTAYTPTGAIPDFGYLYMLIFMLISGYKTVREDPLIVELAKKYQVKPTQIILAWHISRGVGVVPGSKNPDHQKENIDVRSLPFIRHVS